MAYPEIGNCYRVALDWRLGATGATATNVMHFLAPGKTAIEVATAINSSVIGNEGMFDPISGDASVQQCFVTALDGISATVELPALDNWVGTGSNPAILAGCALLKLNTPFIGRSKRGRTYLPFVAEEANDNGFLFGATATYGDKWQTWLIDMDTAGVALAVASYKLESASAVTVITGEVALATQRRRQSRVR